ncbi:MAG: SIS domain-containing protein [Actinobacteria bacterium]|nr:SIS domain-containing protein [Actinomycetota bacterium]
MNSAESRKYIIFREMKSQGKAWVSTVEKYLRLQKDLLKALKDCSSIYFLGSGSSYNNALMAEFAYSKLLDRRAYSLNSSEYLFNPEAFRKPGRNDVIFIISRTGETSDTIYALDLLKDLEVKSENRSDGKSLNFITLTTFPESSIAKAGDLSVNFQDIKEKSITSNRVVSCITLFLLCLLFKLSGKELQVKKINGYSEKFFGQFDRYCQFISEIINSMDFKKFIFLGTGPFCSVAREASLKTREMSISDTEFWPTLEYRQGYMTNAQSADLATVFLSRINMDFQIKTCRELKKIGAKVFVIGDGTGDAAGGRISGKTFYSSPNKKTGEKFYDFSLDINTGVEEELLLQVYYQLFGQLIGYWQALKKNVDPSNPQNLDYVVRI